MRILYLSLSYVPSRRASSVAVMRMCDAFAAAGHEVTLLAKRHREPDITDVAAFYGTLHPFEIVTIPRPAVRGGGLVYAAGVAARVAAARSYDLVYARDLIGAAIAAELRLPFVYEAHGIFEDGWQLRLWRRMIRARSLRGFVVISSAMARILRERGLAPTNTAMIVAHSPAEPPRAVAPRGQVQTPAHIGYVGSLYPGRGVEVIVEIAARRPGLVFDIFGGSTDDLARWRSASVPPNIVFHGFRPPGQLAEVYGGLDVLLMPYPRSGIYGATQRIDTSAYCSPMKMFEYMASGVPMVASDLPVLQEVLEHERNALIVPAADVDAWCTAIDRLVTVPALRLALAQRALADLADYTPSARVHKILGALGPGPL